VAVAAAPVAASPASERASGATDTDPAVDEAVLDKLRALRAPDGRSPLQLVVERFLESTPPYLATLRGAAETGDGEAVRRASHTLKSSTAMVGALRLSSLLRETEALARSGDVEKAGEKVEAIMAEYERVESHLSAMTFGGEHAA
jgi:HPt (histidine-containing phosphotransfer) domain-containing protein